MRLRFWGTRGSCPAPGPHTVRYGGNTTCLEVRTDDDALLIFDAGTGIRELGRALAREGNGNIRGDLFFSHAHWDHIQGLPFFTPAFQEGNHFTLWGAPSLVAGLDVVLRQQMSPVVFPVPFDALRARMDMKPLEGHRRQGTSYDLRTIHVRHPGGALGFRITSASDPRASLVFIPDNELDPSFEASWSNGSVGASRDELVEFVRGARVLVHDAMYTGTEYMAHRGWGHSSYRDAIEFAIDAGVETLVLFHHEPDRSDVALDGQLALCYEMVRERGATLTVVAAAEGTGMTI